MVCFLITAGIAAADIFQSKLYRSVRGELVTIEVADPVFPVIRATVATGVESIVVRVPQTF